MTTPNQFNMFEDQEVSKPKVVAKPKEVKDIADISDSFSLDSTGKSWADMDDDLDDIVPNSHFGVSKMEFVPQGFTKVARRARGGGGGGVTIKCRGCGIKFSFPANKISDYQDRGWKMPKTCKSCGDKKRDGSFFRKIPKTVVELN
jgi:hypothetical protein